jgi:uncharacterized protein (TIGR03067 family)
MMIGGTFVLTVCLSMGMLLNQSAPDTPRTARAVGDTGPDEGLKEVQDRERLQGTWVVTKTTISGKEIEDRGLNGSTWTFRGDELTMDGHEGKERHTLKLDTASEPRSMFTNRVEPARPQSGWMIYELKGDRLKIGFMDALKGKPESFEPREKLIIIELVRETKAVKEGPTSPTK